MKDLSGNLVLPVKEEKTQDVIGYSEQHAGDTIRNVWEEKKVKGRKSHQYYTPKNQEKCGTRKKSVLEKNNATPWSFLKLSDHKREKCISFFYCTGNPKSFAPYHPIKLDLII
jgi:hypothetical protein